MQREDITGNRYGNLIAMKYESNSKWLCKCDCGEETIVSKSNLKDGRTKSCGCQRKNIFKDLTGLRFGYLEAVKFMPPRKWLCLCDCGQEIEVFTDNLTRNHTRSCGCKKGKMITISKTQVAKHSHKIRTAWNNMKSRCFKLKDPRYIWYGGRGITVCERWLDIDNFYADMGDAPTIKHSIDRIDNNGNYEPENCKWSTQKEQCNNQRRVKLYKYEGKEHSIKEWSEIKNVPYGSLQQRIYKLKWSFEKAICTPIRRMKQR